MSKIFIILLLVVFCSIGSVVYGYMTPELRESVNGRFGIGLSHGDPTGLSMKYFMSKSFSFQWHIGWLPLHHSSFGVTMEFLYSPVSVLSTSVLDLVPYGGSGLGFSLWDDTKIRCSLIMKLLCGVAIHWKDLPIDTCIEGGWSPNVLESSPLGFSPSHGDISVKIRYYF